MGMVEVMEVRGQGLERDRVSFSGGGRGNRRPAST